MAIPVDLYASNLQPQLVSAALLPQGPAVALL